MPRGGLTYRIAFAAAVGVILAAALCPCARAQGDEGIAGSRRIVLNAPRDALFSQEAEPTVRPGEGEVLVLCTISLPDFFIATLSQVTVEVDGARVPLTIGDAGVYEEFGDIVALRCAFTLPAAKAEPNAASLRLLWGEGVAAENKTIPALVPDPALRDRAREAALVADDTAPAGSRQVASIEIVADSSAEYYFLWYLLPMGVIFALLAVRKLKLRRAE